jgi:phosphoglycerol transferase MdoB-like AlkP superfamily enzyme
VVVSPLLPIGVRGGLQQISINQSESYFSKHDILNLAAVNSGWNLAHSVIANYKAMNKNPFHYYPDKVVLNEVKKIYITPCDSTLKVLKNERPNIVMIIFEGWSADLVPELGGDEGVTPFFNGLVKDGILFTDLYASGTRSQQGMSAIFSGYPAEPYSTITNEPEKYVKLPSIVKKLDSCGYFTSYYFGGDLNYGNMKGYIYNNHFDIIKEGADLDASLPRGKLGVHDEYTLPVFLAEINKEKQPFFSCLFTLSTHSPYDQNMGKPITRYSVESNYANAAYYSDNCLKKFFEEAKKKSWYSNTLFVFISDHGRHTFKNRDFYTAAYHKIIFMLYGDVIRDEYRGMKINKTGSQVDLSATLLPQLGLTAHEFKWSKDLFNPCSPEFAYFSFEVGLGWVRPCGYYVEEYNQVKNLESGSECAFPKDTLVKEGESYLQELYREYLGL